MVHPYSGLDPDSWRLFLKNLHLFERSASTHLDTAAQALYDAVDNIRDIALGTRRADDEHSELNLIGTNLAIEGELILNENAHSQGLYFFPKYLNNTFDDYVDHVGDPGPVKSHGQ